MTYRKCFIMLCSQYTEQECLNRNLFGDKKWKLNLLHDVEEGDIGFLLNTSDNKLIGIFKAISKPQLNIEPEAWNGNYPAQIRVALISELQHINNASTILKKIGIQLTQLKSKALVPTFPVHDSEITQRLIAHFKNPIQQVSINKPELSNKITEKLSSIDFSNVIGLDSVKDYIKKRMIDPLIDYEKAQKYHLRLGGGLLLYGPPGTGKTMISKATAGEIDAKFIELSPSIIRGFPGEPEKKIEAIFQNLIHYPRSIVFLDEAEALLSSRENQTSTVMQRITPVFLSQFSKLSRNRLKPILIIAATNRPWEIDNAFLRPGRLDKKIYVKLPDYKERINLIHYFISKRAAEFVHSSLLVPENIEEFSRKLSGYSSADIEMIIDEASLTAFNRNEEITYETIKEILGKWHPSIDAETLHKYEEWTSKYGKNLN